MALRSFSYKHITIPDKPHVLMISKWSRVALKMSNRYQSPMSNDAVYVLFMGADAT